MKSLLLVTSAIVVATALHSPSADAQSQTITPARTADFLKSLGVNTHLGSGGAWYTANGYATPDAKVQAELDFLGVKYIRDGGLKGRDDVVTRMVNLNKHAGYVFNVTQEINSGAVDTADDITELNSLVAQAPGSLSSYEGANEYNNNSYTVNGSNSFNNLPWGSLDDQVSRASIQGNSSTANIPYVAASTASVSSAPALTTTVDYTNWHVYGGIGTQLRANLSSGITAASNTEPGRPVFVTETGISSAADNTSSYGTVADEYTQGIIDVNAVLDGFYDGAKRTYLYELMDDNPTGQFEDSFGLFHGDGSAKQAATGLHDMTTLLADTGSTANTFTPQSISGQMTNLPSGASYTLLEKSSGVYDLIMWNSGATIWDPTANGGAGGAKTPTNVAVTISFPGAASNINVFDPMKSITSTYTVKNQSSVTVQLAKDPLIIEITP